MQKKTEKKEIQHKTGFLVYYLLVAAAAFAVYINSLSNEFVFDDESVVLGDPTITNLSNIPKYFTAQEGFHKVIGRYYRPVISASYAIDNAIGGLKPFGFHLTNVIIHVINSLLVLKLLLLMFGAESGKFAKSRLMAALIGALIFAVNPIHTEAVTWVSGRTDSFSFTFFTASFIYYLKYAQKHNVLSLTIVFLFYVLSLLAKEMAITLPVVIILYDIAANKGINKEFIKKRLSLYSILAVLSLLYLFIRWLILKDVPQRETYFYFYGKDALTTFLTMLQTLPLYFRLLIVPVGLLYHYSGYLPYLNSIASFGVLFATAFLLVMAFLSVYLFKKTPLISFSIIIFFVTLLPVMNIVPTMNFMAERFLYIPSLALSVVTAVLIVRFYNEKTKQILILISIAVLAVYSYMTYQRNFDWENNDTLFLSADGRPGTITYVNIGNIYANKQEYDKAEVLYRKAIDLRNETLLANTNLGKIFLVRGNFDSAYYYMYKSYKLDTLSPEPMHALAQLYTNNNMLPEAIEWLEKIQKITPNYMNSAQLLEQLKQKMLTGGSEERSPDESIKVAKLEQDSYKNYQQKNYAKAIEELKELIVLNSQGRGGYYNNIGISYLEQDSLENAKGYFEKAIEIDKNFSTAYNNLGTVYDKLGNKEKARENFIKALEADTNNQNAKDNLNKLK
jgi:protein O-mannosyl-transferase